MCPIKKFMWKLKYARYIKGKLDITMKEALYNAEASLEMVNYDLTEDPIEMADEEIYEWSKG